jgi:hypothetical protein
MPSFVFLQASSSNKSWPEASTKGAEKHKIAINKNFLMALPPNNPNKQRVYQFKLSGVFT